MQMSEGIFSRVAANLPRLRLSFFLSFMYATILAGKLLNFTLSCTFTSRLKRSVYLKFALSVGHQRSTIAVQRHMTRLYAYD